MSPDEREVAMCTHWTWHRLAAKGLLPYPESCIVIDEWLGRPPSDALAAVERGDDDLSRFCPELVAYWASVAEPASTIEKASD